MSVVWHTYNMPGNISKDIIALQAALESSLSVSHRKDFGVFLTGNMATVDKILDVIDFDDPDILSKKFLEPSCGNGVFIVRLLERLFQKNDAIDVARDFIASNIFLVDIDAAMVEAARNNISKFFHARFGAMYDGPYNAYIVDFTQRIKPKHNDAPFNTIPETPLTEILERIDYVVGNPPYVSLYGRRDRKRDESQRAYYLSRYSQFPDSVKNGKINYVMLFIEHAVDFLHEGGKLSFIVDLAFFETAYEYTRRYLLHNTKILSIEYNVRDFEVASGQVILKVEKGTGQRNVICVIDAESQKTVLVEQALWKTPADRYRFRFSTCTKSASVVEKIRAKGCPTLKDLYPGKNLRTCVMLLDMEDLFVFDEPETELDVKIYPYYQGARGLKGKYELLVHTRYFHYNKKLQDKINGELKEELAKRGIKNKKRLGLGETAIYDNPKVYIRQSAKEIIASYDEKPSAANNSLYVFSLRDSSHNSIRFLKFLCGLLNSELITFYAQQMNIVRFRKGKQPQIKTSDLYTIPVPEDGQLQNMIADLVDKIYAGNSPDRYLPLIDDAICHYFSLSQTEIRTLKESVRSF